MSRTICRNRAMVLLAVFTIALLGETAFAKPKVKPELVKEEAGYYYGYGKAATKEDAAFAAKKDLIENALTATVKATDKKAGHVRVSDESVKARKVELDVAAKDKPETTITYRIKVTDWAKDEKSFQEKYRTELASQYETLVSKTKLSDKITIAAKILNSLADNGETELLTAQAAGTELLSRKVEAAITSIAKNLVITISTKDGFVNPDTKYTVNVSDEKGNGVSGLELKVSWTIPELSVDFGSAEVPEVLASVKTDSLGNGSIDFPVDEAFKGKPVNLTVSTSLYTLVPSSTAFRKVDNASAVEGCFVEAESFEKTYPAVKIEAGKFMAGAVAQDSRAGKKEASHEAETGTYEIDLRPVTNGDYAAYLYITHAESAPEYFDNSDYNQALQPVVGVSLADAQAYADWLSEQTGCKYRLPTEEEWEKAARGGKAVTYPWGDDAPNKAKKANYKGNGQFSGPSPVGSFESGNNELGLVDMSGNVWEWTTSTRDTTADSTIRTVKGGSWMDGPVDLRISNYTNRDSQNGYPDVGFRLVKEAN